MDTRSLVLIALSFAGCASPAREMVREEPIAAPLVEPTLSPEVRTTLEAAAVTHTSFARRVLYTWVTDATLARMRSEKRLLVPADRDGAFVERLRAVAGAGAGPNADVADMLLTDPNFAVRRWAWTHPFSTRALFAEDNHLVRAVLRHEAVIARFDTRDPTPFRFVDLDGEEVPLGRVLADPSTLAAVYHVAVDPESGAPFREFRLVNESMIEEWSVGTDEIARVLGADRRALRELEDVGLPSRAASASWDSGGASASALFATVVALDTPRHRPTRENLRAMGVLLADAEPHGPPLVVAPAVAFVRRRAGPPSVPPMPTFTFLKKPTPPGQNFPDF